MRLTLRTLLAYLDDTLDAAEAKVIGQKLADSPSALELVDRIRAVTRRRAISTPPSGAEQGGPSDPNTVAAYLSDALPAQQLADFEETCLASDVHLAEVAACHQILTLILSDQVLLPPTAVRRMYGLAKGRESIPNRRPGKTIPVGGMPADPAGAADDSDAPFLLGMSAYSRSQPIALRLLKWTATAALLFGFGIASYMAWPAAQPRPAPAEPELALAAPPTKPASEPIAVPAVPTVTGPVEPMTTPVVPMPKPPDPQLVDPNSKPAEPKPAEPKPVEPPAADPAPPAEPEAGRIAVAKLEGEDQVLVTKAPDGAEWTRVASGGALFSSDRSVCLPGYRTKLKFDGGCTAELWGTLPELLGIRILETAVTPHIAPKGYDAELTVHVGRVYFNTSKAGGAKIRVRFAKEIWDITLPDSKCEVALELSHELAPGQSPGGVRSAAVLIAMKGSAQLKAGRKDPAPIPERQFVLWTSKARGVEDPRPPDPKTEERDFAYFDRLAVFPREAAAGPTLAALKKFSKRLEPGKSVLDKLTETQQVDRTMLNDETVSGSRFSLYAFASIGEPARIVDAVIDGERPFCRATAIMALRAALATKPDLEGVVAALAIDKLRMDKAVAEKWVSRLRGLSDAERADPATIDTLVEGLSATGLAERELDFYLLSQFVDPANPRSKELPSYDAGGAADRRQAVAGMWKRRAEEIKAAMKNAAPK